MTRIIAFFLLLTVSFAHSQELNCTVTVNTEKLSNANQQVFKTLQTSLSEFVNQTQWTGQLYKQNEKINCSMYITVSSNSSDQFTATIQVQSSRLVYNSTYLTPVFNYNDKDFSFSYTEFQPLIFNPSEFESNLVSVISFYSYMILGMDADTFVPLGGNSFYETAQNISNVAQQSGYKGWSQADGNNSRFYLVNDLLAPAYNDIRQSSLTYHAGLDIMSQDLKAAKEKIKLALLNVGKLNAIKPNAFLTRVFFDAKADEITSIFSGGPSITIADLVESLNKTSPLNSSNWAKIKY
ncbi:DUF4835 domain-containing protein [Flavobacterium alvei]|uniref:DUF4835 domain-containing protein n=1 Tax=Flavobacterium alvei TaxID=2080416 RepID=A0A2S5A871_9FLAO|nr:DUF4835 family protein [Flavobacterium alvei]POY38726.1 DUF4835 domain-containing protein [Flavobacterium alvei]HQF48499.1 DUF4835 family protein [Flavobacterium alvei]HQK38948.1 DUF4835 family protein [Flavobacterium alvei]